MKTNLKNRAFAVLFAAVIGLFAVSCTQEGGTTSPANDYEAIYSAYVSDGDLFGTIQTASIETPAEFALEQSLPEFNGRGDNKRPPEKGMFLGRIMRELQLSEEQRAELANIMAEHRICMEEACLLSKDSRDAIIAAANEERATILADYKAGTIDRETVKTLLMDLNARTREALEADPSIQETRDAQCECLKILFANIESILTEEQLVKWQDFLANFKHPCLESVPTEE